MPDPMSLERLQLAVGVRPIDPAEALGRMAKFIGQTPGLDGVVIIGREGDLATFNCRPTARMESARIRGLLQSAMTRFEHVIAPEDPFETLIQIPGMRQLSFKEARQRIGHFISTCKGMTAVLVLVKNGDLETLRFIRSGNISDQVAREMVRNALIAFDRGLPPPTA